MTPRPLAALAVASALLTGCAGGGPAGGGSAARSSIPGPRSTEFSRGQVVRLTPAGPVPLTLAAQVGQPVRFVNELGVTTSVRFDAGGRDSGPIPAAGTWTYTPDSTTAMSWSTTATSGQPQLHGLVQVEPGPPPS